MGDDTAAPSLQQPKQNLDVNETKHEEHWDILNIRKGQDIGEEVLTYFRNRTKSFENFNGHAWVGRIMSASGLVLYPTVENSSASDEGSCAINTLGGTFIPSNDGQVQQSGPLTISYFDPNWDVSQGLVSGRLIAAGPVQIVVASVSHNSSEDGAKI